MKTVFRLLAIGSALMIVLAYISGRVLIARRKPDPPDTPYDHGLTYKGVFFRSRDGLRLHGWWIPAAKARGTIIQCHGQNGSMDDDIGTAKMLNEADFNVLMFNFRAHGKSEGNVVTFGWQEAQDLLGAIDYLKEQRGVEKVGVLGFSMGAMVAIRTAGMTNRIVCMVLDGTIGKLDTTIAAWIAKKGAPLWLTMQFTRLMLWMAALQTQTPLHQTNTIRWAADLRDCPTLFVHGAVDSYVPTAEIEQVIANAPIHSQLWIVPNCDHREAYYHDTNEYAQHVIQWFSEYLK